MTMGLMNTDKFRRMCHFDGMGHNPVILPGKPAYTVREGEAQGVYHGARCYQAALQKYQALKKEYALKDAPPQK